MTARLSGCLVDEVRRFIDVASKLVQANDVHQGEVAVPRGGLSPDVRVAPEGLVWRSMIFRHFASFSVHRAPRRITHLMDGQSEADEGGVHLQACRCARLGFIWTASIDGTAMVRRCQMKIAGYEHASLRMAWASVQMHLLAGCDNAPGVRAGSRGSRPRGATAITLRLCVQDRGDHGLVVLLQLWTQSVT